MNFARPHAARHRSRLEHGGPAKHNAQVYPSGQSPARQVVMSADLAESERVDPDRSRAVRRSALAFERIARRPDSGRARECNALSETRDPSRTRSLRAQRPLSSTCSTREAVAAWIGRSADRAGRRRPPRTAPGGARRGAGPDDQARDREREPVLDLQRRAPTLRWAGLTETNAPAIARSMALASVAPSTTVIDELSRKATLPSGDQASAWRAGARPRSGRGSRPAWRRSG